MNTSRMISVALLALVLTTSLQAQIINGRFVTSFYTWEKFDTVGSSKTNLRAFQAAQVSVAQGDLSFHTYVLGAMNGVNSLGDLGFVRVYTMYARWANIGRAVDVNVGRQAVYAGAGSGTIDGILARARIYKDQFTVVGYWGSSVRPEYTGVQKNWHDNSMFGGQIVTTALQGGRLGVSYMNRRAERDPYWTTRARDTSFAAVPYYVAPNSEAEQLISGDASYTLTKMFMVYGRYDYDLYSVQTSRGQVGGRVSLTQALSLTADYTYRKPRILYNSIFSAFIANAVSEIEAGVEYSFAPLVRGFARFGNVTYTDETSQRWTVGVNTGYGSLSYSGSNGYAGELTSVNLQAAYPVLNNKLVPNAGVSYASYRLSVDDSRQNALSVVFGAIVRPVQSFSFDVQGQWLANRVYKQDMRLQAKLSYWFSERL